MTAHLPKDPSYSRNSKPPFSCKFPPGHRQAIIKFVELVKVKYKEKMRMKLEEEKKVRQQSEDKHQVR